MAPNLWGALSRRDYVLPDGTVELEGRTTRGKYAARSVTAAAKVLDLGSERDEKIVKARPEEWQDEAWRFADDVGEVDFAASWVANAISRIRLVPALLDDVGDEPVPIPRDAANEQGEKDDLDITPDERDMAHAALRRLKGPDGGHSELLRVGATCMFLPGEFYLYGAPNEDNVETWEALSRDELVAPGPDGAKYGRRRRGPNGGTTSNDDAEPVPDDAYVARVYRRHARYSEWATSNMRAARGVCDELLLHTMAIRATATSRIPAGMLLIPKDASFGAADPTDDEGDLEEQGDKFDAELLEHLTTPVKKPSSAARLVPWIVRLDSEDIDKVKLLDFGRTLTDESRASRAELLIRLATALDLPADVLQGKANLNHWNAFTVDEDGFKYHLEPLVLMLVMGLTAAYYRPILAAGGIEDPGRFCLWYDPSELVSHPNGAQQAMELHDKLVISDAYLRKVTGTPDEAAPSEEEVKRRVAVKIAERARTTVDSTESSVIGETVGEADDIAKEGPPATDDTPGAPPPPDGNAALRASAVPSLADLRAFGRRSRVEKLGTRLARLEAETRARVLQESDAVIRRALDKAGARLRSMTNGRPDLKAAIRGKDNLDVAGALGPTIVEQLAGSNEELLAGTVATLEPLFRSRIAAAREQARAAAARAADETDRGPDALLEQDQDRALDNAWGLLSAGLLGTGAALLYDPHVDAPEVGEFDSTTLVPVRLVRQALLEAGGGPGGDATQLRLDFWSGLLSGELADRMLADFSLEMRSTGTWSCGAPDRPFEPHQELDGIDFSGPADDQLAAPPDEFPFVSFYSPQDHEGCQCDAVYDVAEQGGPEGATPALDQEEQQ